jgi:hypothetical protein
MQLPSNDITPLELVNLIEVAKQGNKHKNKRTKAELSALGLSAKCTETDLKFIFQKLVSLYKIEASDETNFVTCLQPGKLLHWKPIAWKGSNPELATLIYKLTEIKPTPSIINSLFHPRTKFDSQSALRFDNKKIVALVDAALK